jgi:surface antigen
MRRIFATTTAAGLVASALLLGACANHQEGGAATGAVLGAVVGNQFGRGGGRVAATVAGALIGGIVGNEVGRKLDQRDRLLAQEAEWEALERGPSGRPRRWQNPDNGRYGDFTPMEPYRRGNLDCRDYTHTIYIEGRPQALLGTACRNPDGTWQNVG